MMRLSEAPPRQAWPPVPPGRATVMRTAKPTAAALPVR
jgi:hypothetical protein